MAPGLLLFHPMSQTILVRDYMTPSPHSIGVTLTVGDAKNMMKAYQIRHLPVLDGGGLVGLVSDRDVQMIEAMAKGNPDAVSVEEAMSQAVYTVSPTTPLQVCALHMQKHKLGSAVVMEGKRVVGVFTTTDAMRALAEVLAAEPEASELAERPQGTLLPVEPEAKERR
jgi:acetoin utilization protein AcuB